MPDKQGSESKSGQFELPDWGPKKLKDIWKKIAARINAITPKDGLGIKCTQSPGGTQISADTKTASGSSNSDGSDGGGGGATANLYGVYNAAPAIFHLKQSSAPTPLP